MNIFEEVHFTVKFIFKTLSKTDFKKTFPVDSFEIMIAQIYSYYS